MAQLEQTLSIASCGLIKMVGKLKYIMSSLLFENYNTIKKKLNPQRKVKVFTHRSSCRHVVVSFWMYSNACIKCSKISHWRVDIVTRCVPTFNISAIENKLGS